jgi:putative endonuclease
VVRGCVAKEGCHPERSDRAPRLTSAVFALGGVGAPVAESKDPYLAHALSRPVEAEIRDPTSLHSWSPITAVITHSCHLEHRFQNSMPREHIYTVYILGSISGTLYIGITSDLVARVRQHRNHRFGGFTAKYEVKRLLYFETFREVTNAIAREKQLKGWRREKKIALIEKDNPQWKDLSRGWFEKPVVQTFSQL